MLRRFSVVQRQKSLNGVVYSTSVTMDAPTRLPKKGDVLRVAVDFRTPVEVYREGDTLEIISRTRKNPWNTWCPLGNLRVRGKNGKITVWSNIEWSIVEGQLEFV